MTEISIAYWTTTGNTQEMAEEIAEGAKAAGASVWIDFIDELDEDGRQLLPHCRKVIRQRLARRRAIHDDARAVGMHGHLPALRDLIEILTPGCGTNQNHCLLVIFSYSIT